MIRAARQDDAAALADIYGRSVLEEASSFELDPPSVEDMRDRFLKITAEGFPYYVAEKDGVVLGFAYASAFRPRPAYRFTVENSVYVAPAAQGKGVAKTLMQAVILDCQKADYRQMIAAIGSSENTASIRLHESLGFERVGVYRSVGFKFDAWHDVVLMQRAL
ncbi:MAG: N-acetyltransferase family protein [Pseudomonadota bacterium]